MQWHVKTSRWVNHDGPRMHFCIWYRYRYIYIYISYKWYTPIPEPVMLLYSMYDVQYYIAVLYLYIQVCIKTYIIAQLNMFHCFFIMYCIHMVWYQLCSAILQVPTVLEVHMPDNHLFFLINDASLYILTNPSPCI